MAQMRDGQLPDGEAIRVTFDPSTPRISSGIGSVLLKVLVEKAAGGSKAGATVEFYAGADLIGEPIETDASGRQRALCANLAMGSHTFSVKVGDVTIEETVIVQDNVSKSAQQQRDRPTLPNVIDAQEIGNRTQYGEARFRIRVFHKDGNRSQGLKGHVRVIGLEDGSTPEFDTDSAGVVTFPSNNEGPLRHTRAIEYTFMADHVLMKEKITLDQPARYPDPPRPSPNLGFHDRWEHRLRYNNNWRAIFFWLLFIILMVAQTQMFGCGEPRDWATIEAQKYQLLDEGDRFFEDEWREDVGLPIPEESSELQKAWIGIGGWTWWFCASILLPWCIFYTFWVMRDEVWGVVEDGRRMIRERREGTIHTPPTPPGQQPQASNAARGTVVLGSPTSDFAMGLAANFVDRAITSFFRKLF